MRRAVVLGFVFLPGWRTEAATPAVQERLEVSIAPFGPADSILTRVAENLLQRPELSERAAGGRSRILALRVLDEEDEKLEREAPPSRFEATVYDYARDRVLTVRGDLALEQPLDVRESGFQPPPTRAEFEEALEILRNDPELGPRLRENQLLPYRAMPGVLETEELDGRRPRVLTVGLYPPAGDRPLAMEVAEHRIVGVSLAAGARVSAEAVRPELTHAMAELRVCEPPANAGQSGPPRFTAGQVAVTVRRGDQVLWTFRVTRPSASSGKRGSGVELSHVYFRGVKVLHRGHVPILNVHYDDDACGPYRDWQYEENPFEANGQDVAPGFRLCTAPARTILESQSDAGNFSGVAIWVEGQEVVLVSEMEAGWYRYISQWRLGADGTIRPLFGFAATRNSCTCQLHYHNCYWRFDLDVAGAGQDTPLEYNDPPLGASSWHAKAYERMRLRDVKRHWKVEDASGKSYALVPGAKDGVADGYARGDTWFLRYHGSAEFDDGHDSTGSDTEAALDDLDEDESLVSEDVVLWYSAHFRHDAGALYGSGVYLGPSLVPTGF